MICLAESDAQFTFSYPQFRQVPREVHVNFGISIGTNGMRCPNAAAGGGTGVGIKSAPERRRKNPQQPKTPGIGSRMRVPIDPEKPRRRWAWRPALYQPESSPPLAASSRIRDAL
jgi:hypothetical protein